MKMVFSLISILNNCVMKQLCKNGRAIDAFKVFDEMRERGVSCNVIYLDHNLLDFVICLVQRLLVSGNLTTISLSNEEDSMLWDD